MAILQVNFMSKTLMRTVPMQVILPVDKLVFPGMPVREEKPFKTLYLLHGVFGNYTDWLSGTRIQRWAEEKNLVVVMPSGDNAFYVDQAASGNLYGEFIGKELVEVTRKMFHLSDRREDTFIAGLSMGGYGAIRNGLKYYETFGCVAGLSSALILESTLNMTYDAPFFIQNRAYAESCFGDLNEAIKGDKNPKVLAKMIKEKMSNDENTHFPNLYMACGTEDSLVDNNRDFRDYLKENDLPVTYEEGPGVHDWEFWDTYIKKVLDWLPLEGSAASVNSGNVGV